MKLNRALNLVIPVERDESTIYFHSTPISREVYEGNYKIITEAHAEIFSSKGALNGVRIATLEIKNQGAILARAASRDDDGGASALLAEIRRLTVAIAPGANGWETLPVDVAIQRGIVSADEWSEVENAVAFFTLVWWMTEIRFRATKFESMAGLLGLSTTSSAPMEWIGSLPTLTPTPVTTAAQSSIPC